MTKQHIKIPLFNFELNNLDTLNLGDDRIIKAEEIEIENLNQRYGLYYKFNLEMTPKLVEQNRRTVDRAVIVFKLFKDDFIFSDIFSKHNTNDFEMIPHYIPWGIDPPNRYSISVEDESKLIDFWNGFTNINIENLAVNRFHLADYRPFLKDRFLDYMMALEFMLVPFSGEIAYKFRMTGAHILGDEDGFKKSKRFNLMKDLYALRSNIVHAGDMVASLNNIVTKVLPEGPETEELKNSEKHDQKWEIAIELVRRYSRKSIILFHNAKILEDPEERRKWIEDQILDSS